MSQGTSNGLRVEGLDVHRGGRWVLQDLSFAVLPGEVLLVRGANGSGKSTLLRTLAGLTAARRGSVLWNGEALNPSNVHFVGHLNALKPTESVFANADFWRRWHGGAGGDEDDALIDDALEAVGLLALAELPAAVLSQGQQRRLGLARLFLAERPVWLLDEPTAGLDAASRDRLAGAITRHRDAGGAAVVATHEPLGLDTARELNLSEVAA